MVDIRGRRRTSINQAREQSMKRVKTLGLMLIAVFAVSAIVSSIASAVVFEPDSTEATAESTNTKLALPNKLSYEFEKIVMKGITGLKSEILGSGALKEVTTFSRCSAFGVPGTFTETCPKESSFEKAVATGEVKLVLGEGCKIVMKTATCSLTADGRQELVATWKNGSQGTSLSDFALNKAPLIVTSTGGVCGGSGTAVVSGTFKVFQTKFTKSTILVK
jgi:hypothetical protein